MHDIICPHCNKAFKVDETGYADILKQVRDADFHAQLHERLELAEQDKRNAVALAQAQSCCSSDTRSSCHRRRCLSWILRRLPCRSQNQRGVARAVRSVHRT